MLGFMRDRWVSPAVPGKGGGCDMVVLLSQRLACCVGNLSKVSAAVLRRLICLCARFNKMLDCHAGSHRV